MTTPKRLLVLLAAAVMLAVSMGTVLAQESEDEMEGVFSGTAVISNSDDDTLNDSITYELANVEPLADGLAYEGWTVSDDGKIKMSTGVMTVSDDNSISHTYTSPTGDDLIATFSVVVITVEPVPDDDPEPSGVMAYSAVVSPFRPWATSGRWSRAEGSWATWRRRWRPPLRPPRWPATASAKMTWIRPRGWCRTLWTTCPRFSTPSPP